MKSEEAAPPAKVDAIAANAAEETVMQFIAGDVVVHPVYGMGDITAIEEKQFSGIKARLYYQIAFPRSNIWVPIETQAAIGLRRVTAKKDLAAYRDVIKSRPVLFDDSTSRQQVELADRLKEGSFQTMCEVVRDLTAQGWQKPLSVTIKAILRKTQLRLCKEWALAAGISVTEASNEVNTLLQTTQETALK